MAAHITRSFPNGHTVTLVEVPVSPLSRYELQERDEYGTFVRVICAVSTYERALKLLRSGSCSNCGAPAGAPCEHDAGCVDADREA